MLVLLDGPIALLASAEPAKAAEIAPDGFDFAAVSAAMAKSQPGDTIRLSEGTYTLAEAVRVPSGRKLLGAGQEKTRLTYGGATPVTLLSLDGCEDVEVSRTAHT